MVDQEDDSEDSPYLPRVEADLTAELTRTMGGVSDPGISLDWEGMSNAGELAAERLDALARRGGSRYTFMAEVGRGGMGTVIKVYDKALRRPLAMKVVASQSRRPG